MTNKQGETTMQTLTFEQLYTLPTVVDLTTAAHTLGIGRTKAYQLAQPDQFPLQDHPCWQGLPHPHR
jgi:predicted DNA-binding transcriptional regulator AlpA